MQIWLRLSLLGLFGVASLLLLPLERLATAQIDPMLLRLLSIIQPAILVLAFTAIGSWVAPRVGLDAPAVRAWSEHRPIRPILRLQIPAAVVVAVAVAGILIGYGEMVGRQESAARLRDFEVPLATRLLYGGLAEELLTRWGLMSLLVWTAWRLRGRRLPVPAWCYWAGASTAALIFAAGHVPVLFLLLSHPPGWLIGAVLIGNAVPGILFGWLFWRRGLEAAMLAHALAHLLAAVAAGVL